MESSPTAESRRSAGTSSPAVGRSRSNRAYSSSGGFVIRPETPLLELQRTASKKKVATIPGRKTVMLPIARASGSTTAPIKSPAVSASPTPVLTKPRAAYSFSTAPTGTRRNLRRRAVVIGINYRRCGEIALQGAVNDAHLFALTLVNIWGFNPREILLLTDEHPTNPAYCAHQNVKPIAPEFRKHLPERSHIIQGLKWLISGAQGGDSLVLFFAGHGLQLDNLSGWEGEGYDEAILPLDCAHQSGEANAMTAVSIRQLLLSVAERAQLSIFLDCAGGQTMLDVAGTGSWSFVKGVVQKGVWPLTDATDKVHRARYNSKVWTHQTMRAKEVRPRFLPGIEVGNTTDLCDAPGSQNPGAGPSRAHAFLLAGAPHGEVPIEGRMPGMKLQMVTPEGTVGKDFVRVEYGTTIHGAFTWALVNAMNDCVGKSLKSKHDRRVSYRELEEGCRKRIRELKNKFNYIQLEQMPSLTQYALSGSDPNDAVFYPFGGRVKQLLYSDACAYTVQARHHEPTIPRREDYTDAWQVESALAVYGSIEIDRNVAVKCSREKMMDNWRRSSDWYSKSNRHHRDM